MSATEPENEKLQRLYSARGAAAKATPGCAADEEIWAASRGELSAERSRELLAHSLECSSCAESWKVARVIVDEAQLDGQSKIVSFRSRRRRIAMLLAAAAVLALVLIVLPLFERTPQPSPTWASSVHTTLWRIGPDGDEPLGEEDSLGPGDRIYLTLDSEVPAYVYLINRDQRGESTALFPIEGAQWNNPLPAGAAQRLPGGTDWQYDSWEVSSAGGRESFIVVASAEPLDRLESAIALLAVAGPAEYTRGQDSRLRDPATDPASAETALADALEDLATRATAGDVILRRIELASPE